MPPALAAVRQMDGTRTGLQLAHNTATAGPLGSSRPNGWMFDTNPVSQITDVYGQAFTGSYDDYGTASSAGANNYRFIKVTVQATVPLYFLPVVSGLPQQQQVQAFAIAGQQAQAASFSSGGLVPFVPDAHDPSDTTSFGLIRGGQYTLKWGNHNTTSCLGDSGFDPGNAPSEHGFVDLGQGNGNSSLRGVIVFGGYPNANSSPNHVSLGDSLGVVPGNRGASIFSAAAERSNQDPDQTSLTWEAYKAAGIGNGRRIVTAPIDNPALGSGNGSNNSVVVIGFGNFLLDPATTISGNSGSLCAIYIGPASLNSSSSGGTSGTSVYTSMLYQ